MQQRAVGKQPYISIIRCGTDICFRSMVVQLRSTARGIHSRTWPTNLCVLLCLFFYSILAFNTHDLPEQDHIGRGYHICERQCCYSYSLSSSLSGLPAWTTLARKSGCSMARAKRHVREWRCRQIGVVFEARCLKFVVRPHAAVAATN